MRSVFVLNFSAVFKLFQIFQRMCGFSQLPSGALRKSPEVTGNFGRFPPEVSGSLRNFFATLPGKVNKSKMRPTPKKPFPPEVSGSLRKSPEVSGTKKTKKTKITKKQLNFVKKTFPSKKISFFQNANTKHNTHTFCLFPPKPSGTLRNPSENSRKIPGIDISTLKISIYMNYVSMTSLLIPHSTRLGGQVLS